MEDTRARNPYDQVARPAGDTSTAPWITPTAGTGSIPSRNYTRPLSQIHPSANWLEHKHAYYYPLIREQFTTQGPGSAELAV